MSNDFILETDNTAKVLMEKNAAVLKALKVISIEMQKNATFEINKSVYDKEPSPNYPVRTGRLRGSITSEYDGNSAQVGTNVEYAPYVEYGTYKMSARPFLRPAVENYKDKYQAIFKRILENG